MTNISFKSPSPGPSPRDTAPDNEEDKRRKSRESTGWRTGGQTTLTERNVTTSENKLSRHHDTKETRSKSVGGSRTRSKHLTKPGSFKSSSEPPLSEDREPFSSALTHSNPSTETSPSTKKKKNESERQRTKRLPNRSITLISSGLNQAPVEAERLNKSAHNDYTSRNNSNNNISNSSYNNSQITADDNIVNYPSTSSKGPLGRPLFGDGIERSQSFEKGSANAKLAKLTDELANELLQHGAPSKSSWRKLEKRIQKYDPQTVADGLQSAITAMLPYKRQKFCCTNFTDLGRKYERSSNSKSNQSRSLADSLIIGANDVRRADIKKMFGFEIWINTVKVTEYVWTIDTKGAQLAPAAHLEELAESQTIVPRWGYDVAAAIINDWPRMNILFRDETVEFRTRATDEDEMAETLTNVEKFSGSRNAVTVLTRILMQETVHFFLKSQNGEGQPIQFRPRKRGANATDQQMEQQIGAANVVVTKNRDGDFEVEFGLFVRCSEAVALHKNEKYSFHPDNDRLPPEEQHSIIAAMETRLVISAADAENGKLVLKPSSTFERTFFGRIPMSE
jgi:hypothetical protein